MPKTESISPLAVLFSQNQHGQRFVTVSLGDTTASVPAELWITNATEAVKSLMMQGVAVARPSRRMIDRGIEAAEWTIVPNFDHSGWSQGQFALGDGRVIAPPGEQPLPVMFTKYPGAWSSSGDLNSYTRDVLKDLSGQRVLQFAVGVSLSAPLLPLAGMEENPIFDLHGPTSIGKTTALRVAASAWGPPNGEGDRYWGTWNTTINNLEQGMQRHSGALHILDESNHLTTAHANPVRADVVGNAIFTLSQGHDKGRFGGPKPRHKSLVVLSSSNVALGDHLKLLKGRQAEAAAVRLLSVPAERRFGVLSRSPRDGSPPRILMQKLDDAMRCNHGVLGPAFIRDLVRDYACSEEDLRRKLRGHMECFLQAAQTIREPAAERAARGFALVFAALELARAYGVLPGSWRSMKIVWDAYNESRKAAGRPDPVLTQLQHYAEGANLVSASPKRRLTRGTRLAKVDGVFWKPASGRTAELLMSPAHIERAFGDARLGLRLCRKAGVLVTDSVGGRTLQAKRLIVKGGESERVICFDLDALAAVQSLEPRWLREIAKKAQAAASG